MKYQSEADGSVPNSTKDYRESAKNYRGEVFREGNFRVTECNDGIHWLLQRRRPIISPGGAAFGTLWYYTTRTPLIRDYRSHSGSHAPELDDLPETITQEATTATIVPVSAPIIPAPWSVFPILAMHGRALVWCKVSGSNEPHLDYPCGVAA